MKDTVPDKGRVRDQWRDRATYWDRRADEIAEMAARFNGPMLDAADVEPGQQVLDIASGAGEPALSIARRVGETGTVTATDMVGEMLAGARRRAAAAGLANIRFEIVDMEALPFPDGIFDRVTCRFGLMFCPQPEQALAEARRVLMPGGRAAYMVWGPREETTLFSVFTEAADKVFGADDPAVDYETPFRFATEGSVAGLMRESGFAEAEETALRFTPRVPVGEPFWRAHQDMGLGPRLARAGADELAALDKAIIETLEKYRDGAEYQLSVHARIVVGSVT